ncbi:MAG: YbaB/EbfC family nucleoid-associated protein [Candidatus Nomurabacteria bacterium]|jgi:DNA-binding YbaB/EbfC family protein|nr:YbaB/EbfC family nucleoid-associated protein [Candidatus Nomurabacteria bacterium]
MAGIGDQMKMLNQMRKLQKELGKEIVEVEAGDGAVLIQFNGELKVVDVKFDKAKIDLNNIVDLEGWVKAAIRDGLKEAQELAAEKMKPMMGNLGSLGL